MPTSASAEFNKAVLQLDATVRGVGLEPPPPWVIPMREYYEESEREQNELIALQREQLDRLERAGLVRQQNSSPTCQHSESLSPSGGGGARRASRGVQRSMSFAGIFLRGGRRGTDGGVPPRRHSSSASSSPISQRRGSACVGGGDMGSPSGGRGSGSGPSFVRKQSRVGVGMLLSSGDGNDGLDSLDSQSSFGIPSASPASATSAAAAAQPWGGSTNHVGGQPVATTATGNNGGGPTGIVLTKALQDLLRRDANGRPILLKPIYNPYRSSEREEEANMRKKLRPHTLQLIQPLTFDQASESRDPTLQLLKGGQELLRRAEEKTENHCNSLAVAPPHRLALAERMAMWRNMEEDQIEVFRRSAIGVVSHQRQQWDETNRRERGILVKVEKAQQKAASIQAARSYERQRLEDIRLESQFRVECDCLMNAEETFRNRFIAVENSLRVDIVVAEVSSRGVMTCA